ncbi:hypothetical protein [Thermus caldifontis]|uniref:hypothetical protein n=1 Tax=Thermus caldifontis TaxID=1930763 RepID=UPI001F077C95|nr:hypothetical protein [Thermus caldifontis]
MKDAITIQTGDMVLVLPRSMFRANVHGVVQVGDHQVPAEVIYAAWAVGADQGLKVGLGLGAGLTLLALGLLLAARRLIRSRRAG